MCGARLVRRASQRANGPSACRLKTSRTRRALDVPSTLAMIGLCAWHLPGKRSFYAGDAQTRRLRLARTKLTERDYEGSKLAERRLGRDLLRDARCHFARAIPNRGPNSEPS